MNSEKRAYFWGNFYLSSIQQGIQALHCLGEMFVKYGTNAQHDGTNAQHDAEERAECEDMLYDWADHYKTVVVLNGGDSHDLMQLTANMAVDGNDLPWASWAEDYRSLKNAVTCVGIIVDEKIIANVDEVRLARKERRKFNFTERLSDFEYWLVMQIANTYMAR